jgi:hypothetical protein
MSQMGHKRLFSIAFGWSALVLRADFVGTAALDRYVPLADSCTAAKQRRHSITLSAMARSLSGTCRPSAFAVLG